MLHTNRPILQIPKSKLEIVHDVISVCFIILTFAYVVWAWSNLPERFPTHFDLTGKPNGWGGKGSLIFLPILSLVIYAGLTWLRRIPHQFNYLKEITPANAQEQYVIAIRMISWLKVLILLLFAYIEWMIVHSASGHEPSLGLLPVFLLALFGIIAFYIVKSVRKA
ncbi:DUF1648 domain-containing protein [Paenibacillus alba]|uniref:DUF1648 domain-containing protein n=1 Tax=Paenibacillus alba TaxID=1197127 RepID=A0ABU6GHM5_9BACL|nr:DUF1648 domain-containing protein [Paenibacillus alba]MEC0232134.1 DUF1648 domain-containing protein [Paenibacillus alba]